MLYDGSWFINNKKTIMYLTNADYNGKKSVYIYYNWKKWTGFHGTCSFTDANRFKTADYPRELVAQFGAEECKLCAVKVGSYV